MSKVIPDSPEFKYLIAAELPSVCKIWREEASVLEVLMRGWVSTAERLALLSRVPFTASDRPLPSAVSVGVGVRSLCSFRKSLW